jgi:hypothetical protein
MNINNKRSYYEAMAELEGLLTKGLSNLTDREHETLDSLTDAVEAWDAIEYPKRVSTPFEKELESIINKHLLENISNTPDFILAEYMQDALNSFNKASTAREKWYGKELKIGT